MAFTPELSIMVVRQIAGSGAGIVGREGLRKWGGILQPLMPHNCIGVTVEIQGE